MDHWRTCKCASSPLRFARSTASDKLMMETRWYPLVVATAFVAGIVTLTKLFL